MSDITASTPPTGLRAVFARLTFLHLAWVQAAFAMAGSLYFSEIAMFAPCALCWYQRIAMYPLVAIVGVGVLRRDPKVKWYALPLSIIGMGISLFHSAMQYGLIPATACSAVESTSCTIGWLNWLGFIEIPLLSFIAFSVITLSLFLYQPPAADEA